MEFLVKTSKENNILQIMMAIIFWAVLIFYQVSLSPQVKRNMNIKNRHGTCELPHELPDDLSLRILYPTAFFPMAHYSAWTLKFICNYLSSTVPTPGPQPHQEPIMSKITFKLTYIHLIKNSSLPECLFYEWLSKLLS